jgi:hypothetical protein
MALAPLRAPWRQVPFKVWLFPLLIQVNVTQSCSRAFTEA